MLTIDSNFEAFFQETATVGGSVYGVPVFRGQGALFYNTDMLAAAGLEGPPTTMDEYDEYAAKLTQRDSDGNPTVSGWSLRLSGGGGGIAEKFWINLHQYGGTLLEQDGDNYRAGYANEMGLAALRQYVNAVSGLKTVTVEMPADAAAFQREQTAMFIRESWVIGDTAKKAPDLNYKTAVLPRGSIALPVNLYVSGGSEEAQAAAWDFAVSLPISLSILFGCWIMWAGCQIGVASITPAWLLQSLSLEPLLICLRTMSSSHCPQSSQSMKS